MHQATSILSRPRPALHCYSLAVLFVAVASLLRWSLPEVLAQTPYLAFYPAIVAAAFVGQGPGLLATVLSAVAVNTVFSPLEGHAALTNAMDLFRIALFLIGGGGISFVVGRWRATQETERQQAQELADLARLTDLAQVLTLDSRYRIIRWSEGAARLYGFSAEQALGKVSHELLRTQFPEPLDAIRTTLHQTGRWEGELVHHRSDGAPLTIASLWVLRRSPDATQDGEAILEVNTDITDRKRAEEAIVAANRSAEAAKLDAERANAAKDHFLAVLSHELRTPLTPVLPALAELETLVPEPGREWLEMARRNVALEARLIDDLLDVTRISHGKIELDRRPVELCEIIRRAADVCGPDISARHLHFGMKLEDAPHIVDADAARLQQVFWNLIKNAVKFTPVGGCVGIRVCRRGGHVVAEVGDSGVGIDPEALARIFDAFEQEARATTQQFGGLGLGLAISRSLVEMHGGTIRASSEGKGKGSTFTVTLPVVPASLVPVPEQPGGLALEVPQKPQTRPLRILLVEDHGDTARILGQLLRKEGHEVIHAGDITTAFGAANADHFDLLLSDLGLPDGTGHDLMRRLRASGQALPGIALSGYGMAADVQQSHAAGFAEHVTKPVDMESLLAAVNRVASSALVRSGT